MNYHDSQRFKYISTIKYIKVFLTRQTSSAQEKNVLVIAQEVGADQDGNHIAEENMKAQSLAQPTPAQAI